MLAEEHFPKQPDYVFPTPRIEPIGIRDHGLVRLLRAE
jgi:hypothetical protein